MNGPATLQRVDDLERVARRPDVYLKIRIVLLVVAVITPLGGVCFFIINTFQKPISECVLMIQNITSANNLIVLERQVIDRELYDAIGEIRSTERREKFIARIADISRLFVTLGQHMQFSNETENLAILTKLHQSFEEECVRAMQIEIKTTMRNRLDAYQKATEIHSILEKNLREYISLQISNRSDLAAHLKNTIRGLLILSMSVVGLILGGCLVMGILFAGKFSETVRKEMEERIRAENNLKQMVNLDPLTKLASRRFFLKKLDTLMDQCRKSKKKLTLLFIDLDGFKQINDSFGHEAGDEILKVTGQRLCSAVRQHDLVARMGGDEFTVILMNIDDKTIISSVCRRIINESAVPIRLGGAWGNVTTSIGICRLSDMPENSGPEQHKELVARADKAMYEAKRKGKSIYVFYDELQASQL